MTACNSIGRFVTTRWELGEHPRRFPIGPGLLDHSSEDNMLPPVGLSRLRPVFHLSCLRSNERALCHCPCRRQGHSNEE